MAETITVSAETTGTPRPHATRLERLIGRVGEKAGTIRKPLSGLGRRSFRSGASRLTYGVRRRRAMRGVDAVGGDMSSDVQGARQDCRRHVLSAYYRVGHSLEHAGHAEQGELQRSLVLRG
jgi:hypothetical protein